MELWKSKGMCAGAQICNMHTHKRAHTHIHTSTGTSVSISLKSHQPSSLTALQNISVYTNDFNLNLESKLVLASWMDDWA